MILSEDDRAIIALALMKEYADRASLRQFLAKLGDGASCEKSKEAALDKRIQELMEHFGGMANIARYLDGENDAG